MKVLISHDVDHVTVWEHALKDFIIPKFLLRNFLELIMFKISIGEYFNRWAGLFHNRWERIDEIIAFNKSRKITTTFFVGMANGKMLNYSLKNAEKCVKNIIQSGQECGVHGIAFDNFEDVKKEYEIFKKISESSHFGIRMHYLRNNENTLKYIAQSGYLYDASERGMKNPYKKDNIWEFPLQIMDGWVMDGTKRYQTRNLQQAKEFTLAQIKEAKNNNVEYLNILFHDRYYSSSFKTWKAWYEWVIDYLIENRYEFSTYKQATLMIDKQ